MAEKSAYLHSKKSLEV